MALATVASRALAGIDAPEATVEVHLGPGLPAFHIVGLPDAEVREAPDRVHAALNHARFELRPRARRGGPSPCPRAARRRRRSPRERASCRRIHCLKWSLT